MKKLILSVLFVFTVFSACIKEYKQIEIEYFINITGVSADTVRVDDTLEIHIDWVNSKVTNELSLYFDETKAQIIELVNENTLKVIVPSNWNTGILTINHPNGAVNKWYELFKDNYPQIFSVNPISGKANDIITIKGKEFLASSKIEMRINTLACEIIELQDSLIKFKVPTSCGNGLIKLLYWDRSSGCEADKIINVGLFSYNFTPSNKSVVKKYAEFSNNYLLERDAEGRVSKRLHLDNTGTQTNTYDLFIYGTDGLLETITTFIDGYRVKYKVYSRNLDASILEVTEYHDNNELIDKIEIHYFNGRIAQYNYYQKEGNTYWLQYSNQSTFNENKETLIRTFYTINGEVDFVEYYNIGLDIYNNGWPDLGIPGGFENATIYPYISFSSYQYKNIYDETGKLIRIERYEKCVFDMLTNTFEYE